MAAPAQLDVRAENDAEIARAFKEVEKQVKKDLIATDVKPVAQKVADLAKELASTKMQVRSGKLVASIKVGASSFKSVSIRAGAKSKTSGVSYPAIHEFGGRGSGTSGPRAFLTPAAERYEDDVKDAMEQALDKYARRADLL